MPRVGSTTCYAAIASPFNDALNQAADLWSIVLCLDLPIARPTAATAAGRLARRRDGPGLCRSGCGGQIDREAVAAQGSADRAHLRKLYVTAVPQLGRF